MSRARGRSSGAPKRSTISSRVAVRAVATTANASRSPVRGRRIARLTQRGWVLLVIGLAVIPSSYWFGRRELLYLGFFLVLLPVFALASVRLRRMRLSVQRSFSPMVVSVGHPVLADVEVGNLASFSTLEANWRDSWPWYPFASEPAQLPSLPPKGSRFGGRGSRALFRYQLTPPIRGVFEVGPILVDFADPFGLADGALVAGASAPLIVTPEIVALADGVVSISADEGPTRMMQRRALGGEDDLMAREYRRGDALRRVHWRASAHAGQLMVRQEEQRSHAEARILLDTRRGNYRDVAVTDESDSARSDAFEWAVTFTASLGMHLARNGFLVQVIETAPTQLASLEHPDEFLESLASVALSSQTPGELSLLHGVQRPDRSQGSVFAVLSDADAVTVDRLAAQRHAFDLAVVFLVSPRERAIERTLTDAGWVCVRVDVDEPIDAAWAALGAIQASPALIAERAGARFQPESRA